MERPKSAELDAILKSVEEIRVAESRIRDLKEKLSREAKSIANIPDKHTRIKVGVYAYWFAPEAHAADLSFGATGRRYPGELRQYAGSMPTGVHCNRCQSELEITSREQMKRVLSRAKSDGRYPEGFHILCGGCWEAVFEERDQEHARLDRLRAERGREIAKMGYAEYLQTDEWMHRREAHLRLVLWATKSPLKCEACGATDDMGVYHKNLERLGLHDDLVLLCQICQRALCAANRLAGESGPRNRVSRVYAARLAAEELYPEQLVEG